MYAANLELTAGSQSELQWLLDICIRQVSSLGLQYSAQKCVVLRWVAQAELRQTEPLTVQGQVIPYAATCQYLRVAIGMVAGYLEESQRGLTVHQHPPLSKQEKDTFVEKLISSGL